MKKIVALAPPHKNEIANYTTWLDKREIPYRILKPEDNIEPTDILMLCGGIDVFKRPERDANEFRWFKSAYARNPIIGICRGMQLANLALEGTLYENLNPEDFNSIEHRAENHESQFHMIKFINSDNEYRVNSRHHQAVSNLAPVLEATSWSSDGVIESAIGDNALFVQWHPEREEVYDTYIEQMCSNWIIEMMTIQPITL